MSRILCLLGRHHRSRGQARRSAEGWRSRCRRCGTPMVKLGDADWRVEERAGDATAADAVVAIDAAATPLAAAPRRRWRFARRAKPDLPVAE